MFMLMVLALTGLIFSRKERSPVLITLFAMYGAASLGRQQACAFVWVDLRRSDSGACRRCMGPSIAGSEYAWKSCIARSLVYRGLLLS